MEVVHPARYFLEVSISSVTYVSGDTRFYTCENIYPVYSRQIIFINKDKVKTGDKFMVNQQIEDIVRFFGESRLSHTI